jgi:uncharacterized protein (DUF3084 family)
VVAAACWLGLSVAMSSMAVLGLGATDRMTAAAGYELMGLIGTRAIAAAAIATVLTGLMLSASTPWRRYPP